jgi:hypothetical protein
MVIQIHADLGPLAATKVRMRRNFEFMGAKSTA